MRVNIVPELGPAVGNHWLTAQSGHDGAFRVAAPLSSTPIPVYEWVVAHAESFTRWQTCEFVLMDEQVEGSDPPFNYVDDHDAASYEAFARVHLIDPLCQVLGADVPVIKPDLARLESFETPIDLLILAVGPSGNFANVMPGTPADTGWHIAKLSDEFRTVHTQPESASYAGAAFRTHGMSLGPQQVLAARDVVVIASGKHKSELVAKLLGMTDFAPAFPVSIIHGEEVRARVTCYFTPDVVP